MKTILIKKNKLIVFLCLIVLLTSCSKDKKDEIVLGKFDITHEYDDFIIWDYKFDCPSNWRKVYDPDFSYANSYTEDMGLWTSVKNFKNAETSMIGFFSYLSLVKDNYDSKDNNFRVLSRSQINNIEKFSGEFYDDQGEKRIFIGYRSIQAPNITIIYHSVEEKEQIIEELAARSIKSLRKIE